MKDVLMSFGFPPLNSSSRRMVLDHKYLTPNYALRSAIEDWKQENEGHGEGGDEDGAMQGKRISP